VRSTRPDAFDPQSVPVLPAATVMLVRDAAPDAGGVEVFMLRRSTSAVFGAGMYVFPGGRVDGIDGADDLEPFVVGLDDAAASSSLGIEAGGLAYWVAAIRECFEEAGVLLARRRDGAPLAVRDDDRHAVHDGALSMADLCRRDDLVLDLSTTHYVAHWITPAGEARRFDTRFFVTLAPAEQEPLHDDGETIDSLWVRPDDAIAMHEQGRLAMMPPTVANLRFLAPHDTAQAAVDAAAAIDRPRAVLPRLRVDGDGRVIGVAMPDDPDYSALGDPDATRRR
jgi:8-oxo-dGTP pyrophosphatase MutT (NUDIX family)